MVKLTFLDENEQSQEVFCTIPKLNDPIIYGFTPDGVPALYYEQDGTIISVKDFLTEGHSWFVDNNGSFTIPDSRIVGIDFLVMA